MSNFLKDVLGFESFNAKDIWKKIKKDPERLLLGATDPFATRIWNQTGFGKDWEPLVDQFGGAYGGSALTLGDTGQGVYGRAKAAGVPTEAGSQMHDVAHLISSIFAGGYGADKLGSLAGFQGGGNLPMPGGGMKGSSQQTPYPLPPFVKTYQPGTLPTGQPQLSSLLSNRNPNQLAILSALLRSQNG